MLRSFLLSAVVPVLLLAQERHSETIILTASDTSVFLGVDFILPGSEVLLLDSTSQLVRNRDYTMHYRYGRVVFTPPFIQGYLQGGRSHRLDIKAHRFPVTFKREYALKRVDVRTDTAGQEQRVLVPAAPAFSVDDLFGDGLQKSGSLVRGFTFGSNREVTLNSGFRMQLAGTLSQDVDVVAALTDENSPIQPEGTTQTLQEVDQVYVELRNPTFRATLGDFNVTIDQSQGGEFGRINRKLQGAQGTVRSSGLFGTSWSGEASLTAAAARGKYHSMTFQGREGNQGPYRLSGQSGERLIIVVAGTERVYLNGELMTRGEVMDYTIDYAAAEVTFTSRRLITSASRIVVDYEYTDRSYERNYAGATVQGGLLNRKVLFNATFLQEADDPDAPIDASLDDRSRSVLAAGGADRFKASLPGATFVGSDSVTGVGKGSYERRDSLINGKSHTLWIYAPGTTLALYSVRFSFVDQMPADSAGYVRIGLGQFAFAGIGKGNYLPIQFVPLPSRTRLIDINASADIIPSISVTGEYAASDNDRNRLSSLDPGIADQAFKFTARMREQDVSIGSLKLGNVGLSVSERFVGKYFTPLDRANEVEFGRKWNFDALPPADEEIREAMVSYRPIAAIGFRGTYGSLVREGTFKATRMEGNATLADSLLGNVEYTIESIESADMVLGGKSSWLRQRGDVRKDFGLLNPGFGFNAESRSNHAQGRKALQPGSFRFAEISPRVSTDEFSRMKGSAEVQIRTEDSTLAGAYRTAFRSLTQLYGWQLRDWNTVSSSVTLSIRATEFTEDFRRRGNLDSDVIMVRSETRFSPWQRGLDGTVFYAFSNQRSARLERVFVRVAKGEGNYRYRGDLNGNSQADENEFELTRFDGEYIVALIPGETLHPVADLQASLRLRVQPGRLFNSPSSSALSWLSTETYLRADEKSSDPNSSNIYFLRVSRFLNDRWTISGAQLITQDIHAFENQPDFSTRFRFSQRKGLLQLLSATERSYARERSVRVRWQMIAEVSNETEYTNRRERVLSTTPTSRERDLVWNTVNSDFSYRPERSWEVGFRVKVGQVTDELRGDDATAGMNEQSVRVVYGILTKGQIRSELTREEVLLERPSRDPGRVYPFEFTEGRVFGKSFLWSASLDYRINVNIQVTVQYEGRSEGGGVPVHLARAEARAFF